MFKIGKLNNKKIAIGCSLLIIFLVFFVSAQTALAETICKAPDPVIKKLQVEWPAAPLGGYTLTPETTLAGLVGYFFGWGVGLGGLAVFISLIIAGIQYITSIADPGKIKEAKDRIKSSLIGLVLLLSSWAIFNLINPNLNHMTDKMPPIPKDQNGSFLISSKECGQAIDCCNDDAGIFDENCIPKNWRCCQANDARCIEKGKLSSLTPGTTEDWSICSKDTDCKNLDCGCNNGIDPATGEKTGWQKICLPNPKVCVATTETAEMGCDIVRFYSNPDFNGNQYTDGNYNNVTGDHYDVTVATGGINGNWIYFPQGTVSQPKSYEAFTYAKNPDGTTSTKLQRCGFLACGCQINRCLDNTRGAGSGDCVNKTADKNSGEFMEYAYSNNNLEYISGIMIKDKTKQGYVMSAANQAQNLFGAIKDLLGF